ncbi:MAG: FAD-binding protein [Clostridia bacterium]|nr:FAD-binding protein [Clostridia bacterium]
MRIAVCIKPTSNGDISPFDAAAYECALRIPDAEVFLVSMAPKSNTQLMSDLTRLGAKKAFLISDNAFSGSDTLATAYTLSEALKKDYINPDLIFCGRQSLEGDTAQVGVEIAAEMGIPFATRVMELSEIGKDFIKVKKRDGSEFSLDFPSLITFERIAELRLPSIRSKPGEVEIIDSVKLGIDLSRCGRDGSMTVVLQTFPNQSERRKCVFIDPSKIRTVIEKSLSADIHSSSAGDDIIAENTVDPVWVYGEKALKYAKSICKDPVLKELTDPDGIVDDILTYKPKVVLWENGERAKDIASFVAAGIGCGLCADCTKIETDGENVFMYRPAFGENVIAKIKCKKDPSMATVRTETDSSGLVFSVGTGAVQSLKDVMALSEKYGAEITASRRVVDKGFLPYEMQVGLTGKTISPKVYLSLGISGAIHHVVGMKNSLTVIAVNSDRNAAIFDYADFGIVASVEDVLKYL